MSGIIAGALGGLGQGAQAVAQDLNRSSLLDQQQQNAVDLTKLQSNLALQKEQAIEQFRQNLQNAPIQRAGALVQQSMGSQVPVQAAPITNLSGADPNSGYQSPDGTPITGLTGDYASLKAQLSQIQDPNDRAIALAQLERQRAADQATADAAVAGKLRAPTTAEAMQSAYQTAISNGDLQAAAQIKAMIPDKLMKLGKDETVFDIGTGKPVYANTSGADADYAKEKMKQDREDARAILDRENRLAVANLKDTDPQFIKVLKATYKEGTPEYDEALRQYINKESGINPANGGGRAAVYHGRIIASGNEVAAALKNITQLPVTANAGILGFGKPEGAGLFSATAAALKNELNSDQIKDYNTMWTGVARNLGTLETSGLATTGSLIASIDKLQFAPGDNGYNAMRKLAEVRQITDAALEPKLADPTVPPQQKQYIQEVIDKVAQAVPYTHADLTAFKRAQDKNPGLTFADYAKQSLGAAGMPVPSTDATHTPKLVDFGSLR